MYKHSHTLLLLSIHKQTISSNSHLCRRFTSRGIEKTGQTNNDQSNQSQSNNLPLKTDEEERRAQLLQAVEKRLRTEDEKEDWWRINPHWKLKNKIVWNVYQSNTSVASSLLLNYT